MDTLDKIFEQDRKESFLEEHLVASLISMEKEYPSPEHCLTIYSNGKEQKLLTLGNFSAVIGKQKSKKSFLLTTLMAAGSKNIAQGEYVKSYVEGRDCVYFDTEQGAYDVWKIGKTIDRLNGNMGNIKMVSLRSYSPKDRLELVEYAIKKYSDSLGYVVIDGIADLVTSINDESEAVDVSTRLLRWTNDYNIHISVAIHQRKGDGYARGHIGTAVINKAECVISSTKDELLQERSVIKCEDMRGGPSFEDLFLEIIDGIPHLYPIHGDRDREVCF